MIPFIGNGQSNSARIIKQIQALEECHRVLYIAAHPDDENTRFIAYMVNGRNVETAYLSLTRGDGGQNLIGTELGAQLGVLRTQELLAARRIDGGHQFFTRAVDFGYSKTADETLELWDKQSVLADVVLAIRRFRPDVVITRFPPDERAGHGHHTASAMLALEAFDLAGNPNAFPEQLENLNPWQPKSVYWNASSWWNPRLDTLALNNPDYLIQDIGGYDPVLGVSYVELGSLARSQHKCQGFGVRTERGKTLEYFQYMKGERLKSDFFESTNRTWSTISNAGLDKLVHELQSEFDPQSPSKLLPKLMAIYNRLPEIKDDYYRGIKEAQLKELILSCAGIYMEANAIEADVLRGKSSQAEFRIIVQEELKVKLNAISCGGTKEQKEVDLPYNEFYAVNFPLKGVSEVGQYWLRKEYSTIYNVEDNSLIGLPENPPIHRVHVFLTMDNQSIEFEIPVDYKWSDRVEGEQRKPVNVVPRLAANFEEQAYVFAQSKKRVVALEVRAFDTSISTNITLDLPPGWTVRPALIPLDFSSSKTIERVEFTVEAPDEDAVLQVRPVITNVVPPVLSMSELTYSHIPNQKVFLPSSVTLVSVNLKADKGRIGYIQGAGDEVDKAIVQMGYSVDELKFNDFNEGLNKYQAIVLGIRAINTVEWLPEVKDALLNYVNNGGILIVQYNTVGRKPEDLLLAPYSLKLGRDRVTEENSEVKFIDPNHPLLKYPNKISQLDFEGWVQERGLYFAGEWDEHYEPLLSWHDKGESPKIGGLLFAEYGKGAFIYTGISFFRQLPAGVPGAYRLLANMLSYDGR